MFEFMTRDEFEEALKDFETQLKKKLPSMINSYLANRGNREYEAAFTHLVDTLQRQRKNLLRDLTRVARLEQKIRYFNAIYNMDSQFRSIGNRDAMKEQMKLRRHLIHAPVVYDIGEGPEEGEILNVGDKGILLETTAKVSIDHEVKVSISGKKARGKAMWSISDKAGHVETGIKLMNPPEDFMEEVKKILEEEAKGPKNP
jgi:hypothetical protein